MDLPAGWLGQLQPLFEALPDDVVAIDFRGHDLGCYWLERPASGIDAVANIKASLASIGGQVAALSAEAE